MQKHILAHRNAMRTVTLMEGEVQNQQNFSHPMSLTREHSATLITGVASAPIFAVPGHDFALALRARLQLPCLLTPIQGVPAHLLLAQATVRRAVHDALRDTLLVQAALSDHFVRAEPKGIYDLPAQSQLDGVVDINVSAAEEGATGVATSTIAHRIAFDVFTAGKLENITRYSRVKQIKYLAAVEAVGDRFAAVPFTPCGIPYQEAVQFIRLIAHTGDLVPANATNDCSRFVHESQTYVTMTHTQHTIHACVLAAAKASACAMRAYAHTRSVNIAVVNSIARAPPVVPTPHMNDTTHTAS